MPCVKPRTIRLPDDVWARAEQEASARGMKLSQYIRELIQETFVSEDRQSELERIGDLERRVSELEESPQRGSGSV